MKRLTALVEQILDTVKGAAKISVTVGWKPSPTVPSAVIMMKSCEIAPLDLSASKQLVDASFQIDVWHVSAKARDEAVERIVTAFDDSRGLFSERFGVFSLAVEGIADVGDESGFRKMLFIRFRMVD